MTATKIQPGDDLHLTSLMAPHSLNFVTGADRAALLAYGRDVFAAGLAGAAPAAVAGPADDLAELAMLNKLVELGTQAYGALAKSNSDDGPAGTAAYVRWQERRAEMGELIRAHKAPALEAPAAPVVPADEFRGDTSSLVRNIIALLEMDAEGCLVPHGVGGHARGLLSAAAARLAAAPQAPAAPTKPFAYVVRWAGILPDEKPIILWPNQIAAHEEGMRAAGQTIAPLYEGAAPAAPAVDAVDADGARYRYLRDEHIGDDPESINLPPGKKRGLDSAVDAAIAAQAAAKGERGHG